MVFKTIRYPFDPGGGRNKLKLQIMNELEQKIIELRKEGLTYRSIQLKLGNPSKDFIKQTLRTYAPELAGDVVPNYNRLK